MAFFIASSPHSHSRKTTSMIMLYVILATLPGIASLCYYFGWGVVVQISIATLTALMAEMLVAIFRRRAIFSSLKDNSALLTAILIGIAIPPLVPWWIAVIGTLFAIIVAKQLYGGLGQNLFNPAMIAYVVLLVGFPVQMTSWLPPSSLTAIPLTFMDVISTIFTGLSPDGFSLSQLAMTVDGITMATPLDSMKTALNSGKTVSEAFQDPIFGVFVAYGWSGVNAAFLLGGMVLLKLKIIQWQIPAAMLSTLFLFSLVGYVLNPDAVISPLIHFFSGATMFGAFFIATDPVTAATSPKGRLFFGAMIGALIYLIRTFGSFPDSLAFAVLIANMCVPLIDYYTKPTAFSVKENS